MNTKTDRTHARQTNQWVLLDSKNALLGVGRQLFHGTSPRTGLDAIARHILLPQMQQATRDGKSRVEIGSYAGRDWWMRVIPIHGPVVKRPLAVLGCYGPDPDQFPPPPLVGSWEWHVQPPGSNQTMRTFWSPEMFDAYGIPRPCSTDVPFWEGPRWLDELIAETDRPGVRSKLDQFLAATTEELHLHTFHVRNRWSNHTRTLRLAGRSYLTEAQRWFRGISVQIDSQRLREHADEQCEFAKTLLKISSDSLCAIDTTYEQVYLTNEQFRQLDITLPGSRNLHEMVHRDDLPTLRKFLAAITDDSNRESESIRARFCTRMNGWLELEVTGMGFQLRRTYGRRHALCRIDRIAPA